MKLLLDTHVWLWAILSSDHLSPSTRQLIEESENALWLSPISVWEAYLLAEQKRIELDAPIPEWLDRELTRFPLRDAALTRPIAVASRSVSLPHRDPADRFIVATAAAYDLDLVTADERVLGTDACRVVRADSTRSDSA